MDDKSKVTLKLAVIFEIIYKVLLVIYLFFSAVMLGLNFGIDFLSELKNTLINKYGDLTAPIIIITTILIFVPFCISVFLNIKQLNSRVDKITDIKLPSLNKAIEQNKEKLKQSREFLSNSQSLKKDFHNQKNALAQKIIDVQGAVNKANYINLQINEHINKIAMHTELADDYDFKFKMAEYEKSLEDFKSYIRTDYSR